MQSCKKILQIVFVAATLSLAGFYSKAQQLIKTHVQEEWIREYEPFRIAGNLYYVGSYDLACYLITTPQGHILINTGVGESVSMIRSHIEALGFQFADIKILLATHAHYDHVGGMAEIKKLTGAQMMINENDALVLADGGNSDYAFGGKGSTFAPVKADRLLHENDTIRVGNMEIVALHHPGHTKGASSFLFNVTDEHRTYKVLIANMPTILSETKLSGMPGNPNVAKDYAYTLDTMKKLRFDIWLSSHASQAGLHEKHKPGDTYHPEAFIDRSGYDKALAKLKEEYIKRLGEK